MLTIIQKTPQLMQVEGFSASLVTSERLGLIIGTLWRPCQHETVGVMGLSSPSRLYTTPFSADTGETKRVSPPPTDTAFLGRGKNELIELILVLYKPKRG